MRWSEDLYVCTCGWMNGLLFDGCSSKRLLICDSYQFNTSLLSVQAQHSSVWIELLTITYSFTLLAAGLKNGDSSWLDCVFDALVQNKMSKLSDSFMFLPL